MADRSMFRGDTFVFDIQVKRIPPGAPPDSVPVPIDVTGWKFWFTAKNTVVDPDTRAISQVTSDPGGGIVVTDAINGKAEITMPALATRNFPDSPVVLVYDVQAKDTALRTFTIEIGTLTVTPDVTRALS